MTKNIILIVVGINFPSSQRNHSISDDAGLSGIVWRVLVALLGIVLIFLGVKK